MQQSQGETLQPRPGTFTVEIPRVPHLTCSQDAKGHKAEARGAHGGERQDEDGPSSEGWEQGMKIGNCKDSGSDVIAPPPTGWVSKKVAAASLPSPPPPHKGLTFFASLLPRWVVSWLSPRMLKPSITPHFFLVLLCPPSLREQSL